MSNQSNNNNTLNILIASSLILNMAYIGVKLYGMYQEKKEGKCKCQEGKS